MGLFSIGEVLLIPHILTIMNVVFLRRFLCWIQTQVEKFCWADEKLPRTSLPCFQIPQKVPAKRRILIAIIALYN